MKTKMRDKIFLRWLPLALINVFVLVPIYVLKRGGGYFKKADSVYSGSGYLQQLCQSLGKLQV